MTRRGKIARLPAAVREELNQRLLEGGQGKPLVEWLHGLPEVQAVMQAQFEGRPIAEHNLSVKALLGIQEGYDGSINPELTRPPHPVNRSQ